MAYDVIITDNKLNNLNPVLFGYDKCDPNHFYGPAIRQYWLIHYIVSGSGIFKIGNFEYHLNSGDLFIIPPNVETFYVADNDSPWEYIFVGFTSSSELPYKLQNTLHCPQAQHIFFQMKQCENFENGRSAYLSARLWDFFALLLDDKDSKIDYVDKALNYIKSDYISITNISQIAKRLHINRSYFSSLFNAKMGISPKEYLIRYKLEIAAELMTKENKSISLSAFSVGYNNIYNFSKVFKKYYGVSPRTYISNYKKTDLV